MIKKKFQELFEFCENHGLSPNQLYILYCIDNKHRPSHTNDFLEIRSLIREGCISDTYEILDKGRKLLDKLNVTSKQVANTTNVTEVLKENVVKYLNLFPSGKLPSGKAARVNKTEIIKAFTWFFANYEFSWDIVLEATAYYVDTYEKNHYRYMKNSQYFIRKQVTGNNFESDLANYCEMIINGEHLDDTSGLIDKVV